MSLAADDLKARDARTIAERTRTLDQIKRLYAVVMGFAVTQCVARGYSSLPPLSVDNLGWVLILLGQGITFASLIVLFYLGCERMLDIKYLGPASPVPRPRELAFDLSQMGVTAVMFVILAHSIPENATTLAAILEGQREFTLNLIVLYAIDVLLLVLQFPMLLKGATRISGAENNAVLAYAIWIALNFMFIPLLWLLRANLSDAWLTILGVSFNALSLALLLTHLARFYIDFRSTFRFYYPPSSLSGSAGS